MDRQPPLVVVARSRRRRRRFPIATMALTALLAFSVVASLGRDDPNVDVQTAPLSPPTERMPTEGNTVTDVATTTDSASSTTATLARTPVTKTKSEPHVTSSTSTSNSTPTTTAPAAPHVSVTTVPAVDTAGLYTVDGDGTNLRRLTASASLAVWSPDGRRLAYLLGSAIHVLDAVTGDDRAVADGFSNG